MHPDFARIPRGALIRASADTVPAISYFFFFHSKAVVYKEQLRTNSGELTLFLNLFASKTLKRVGVYIIGSDEGKSTRPNADWETAKYESSNMNPHSERY